MNNSEILFLYDAKMTNPNGNIDDENRPRMDYDSGRNLVSDVRLKRYIRDFMEWKGQQLYVGQIEGKTVNAEKRLEALFANYDGKIDKKNWSEKEEAWMLDQLVDVRLFGATMAVKGMSMAYTGPVQFSWGYSLNKVKIMENSITTHFSSTGTQEQGTIGKDYRVVYSFLSFYGQISGRRAEQTRLTEQDLELLDEAMIKAIPLMATRSKIGQAPRMYMRLEYNDDLTMIGDWRDFLPPLNGELTQLSDVELDVAHLIEKLERSQNHIAGIHLWSDADMGLTSNGIAGSFESFLSDGLRSKVRKLEK